MEAFVAPEPGPEPTLGYFGLLKHKPDFRRLWIGEVVSYLGDWFNLIALYTAVQALSDSAQAVAAVMIAKMLPALLVSPIAGPIIDRWDRKKILIATDLGRAVCTLGLIAAYRASSLTGLFACTVAMVVFGGFVLPTKSAVLPMVVGKTNLAVANALSGGTWSVMLAVGAALGGLATELVGITASFAIDGITFLISAAFFMGLPRLDPPNEPGQKRDTRFVEGVRYLRRAPFILATMLQKPLMAISMGAVVLIPILGNRFPGRTGPLFVGLLFAVRGAGALTGSMFLRMIVGDAPRTLRRLILFAYVVVAVGFGCVAIAESYALTAVGFYLAAVGSGTVWVYSGTLIQLEGDARYHGRIFSMEFGATMLTASVSSWLAGFLLDRGWAEASVAQGSAMIAVVPFTIWLVVLIRHHRIPASGPLAQDGPPVLEQ